jgi:nucleotide-binding universal stress UspA family protein
LCGSIDDGRADDATNGWVVHWYYLCYNKSTMPRKQRLTVTVDVDLIEAGSQAVASGRAQSLSGWVNDALADRREKEQRLTALATAVAEFERRSGTITAEEIAAQQRADRTDAVVVRHSGRSRPRRGRKRAA